MKTFPPSADRRQAAFTMVEIALCLAIIGFALVALIGILPAALNVQKENRQDTTINNDAQVWLDAIRSGSKVSPVLGAELNVFTLTNWTTEYDPVTRMVTKPTYPRGLTATNTPGTIPGIVLGFLSTPRLYEKNGVLYSNYVTAYVRAFTSPAVNQAPQDNPGVLELAFTYVLSSAITPHATPPEFQSTNYVHQLTNNLWEVQLTLDYPLLPTGKAMRSRTYRATVGGQLLPALADWQSPASAGGWTADLYSFRPGQYFPPQP